MPSTRFIRTLALDPEDVSILETIGSEPLLIAEIQKKTTIPRSTVAYKLASLSGRGLVKTLPYGKRIRYKAVLESDVLNTSPQNDSPVNIYRGVPEMMSLWEKISNLPKNTRFVSIQPPRSIELALKKSPAKFAIEISQRLKDRGFIFDSIGHAEYAKVIARMYGKSADNKKLVRAFTKRLEDLVKVPDDFLNEDAELYLFRNTLVIMDWNEEVSIEIRNPAIYRFLVAIFEKVKAYGSRFNLSDHIQSLSTKKPA